MTSICLRPYASLEGIFEVVEYRASRSDAFRALPVDGNTIHHVVRVDDLRLLPQHEFRLTLNHRKLKPHYHRHRGSLQLVVITRDNTLRREIVLARHDLPTGPAEIVLAPPSLAMTAHRDCLPLVFSIVAVPVLSGGNALPTQRASRLAELHVTLINSAGGVSFPYKRVTSEELAKKGLPSETGLHLELLYEPKDLLKDTDSPAHALFEVWLHESLWAAVQNDKDSGTARIRNAAITEATASMLLGAVAPIVKGGERIEEGSVVGQLLRFLDRRAGFKEGMLQKDFEKDCCVPRIGPYIQHAFRYLTVMSTADEVSE